MIKTRLKQISEAEGISISSPALGLVAKAADGSVRDSLTILDQLSSFTSEIMEEHVQIFWVWLSSACFQNSLRH